DTGAPDVPNITTTPANPSNQTAASFAFSSVAPDVARYECRIDADPSFTTCGSPANYAVGAGSHTFRVRAVDTASNVSGVASYTWTVDLTDPDTTITSGPGAFTNQTSATFTYTSTETGSNFQCHLDAANWGPCPSNPASQSYSVGEGTHTFYVRAVDPAGNFDKSEASYTWNVIVTPPQTTITSG